MCVANSSGSEVLDRTGVVREVYQMIAATTLLLLHAAVLQPPLFTSNYLVHQRPWAITLTALQHLTASRRRLRSANV